MASDIFAKDNYVSLHGGQSLETGRHIPYLETLENPTLFFFPTQKLPARSHQQAISQRKASSKSGYRNVEH